MAAPLGRRMRSGSAISSDHRRSRTLSCGRHGATGGLPRRSAGRGRRNARAGNPWPARYSLRRLQRCRLRTRLWRRRRTPPLCLHETSLEEVSRRSFFSLCMCVACSSVPLLSFILFLSRSRFCLFSIHSLFCLLCPLGLMCSIHPSIGTY
ncbi:hypothetical protein PLICRDRAFT_93162, partial [Plicaturopsis crispa FD-325 SS-3]